MRRWRAANIEKARRIERESYHRNRESRLARLKAAYHANRPLAILRKHGIWSNPTSLLEAYESGCSYCRRKESIELDHKHPRSLGGTNELSNLQWLCALCNRAKSNLTEEEFYSHIERIIYFRCSE
jgi:5-methylcytosine-specific restriction endonuclease McrA